MKKVSKIIIAVILAMAFVASSLVMIFANINSYYIHIKKTSITKNIGDVFNIISDCDISTYAGDEETKPVFQSGNSSLLYVSSTGDWAYCIKEGETKIIVTLNTDRGTIKKEIKVNITQKITYPTYVTLPKENVVLTDDITFVENKIDTDGENMRYEVSYENNLVEYDFETGKVTKKGEYGNDTVTIKLYKQDGTYFEVSFVAQVKQTVVVRPEKKTINLNETVKLEYDEYMLENGALIYSPTFSDSTIVRFEEESSDYGFMFVTGLKAGETEITVNDGLTKVIFTVEVLGE